MNRRRFFQNSVAGLAGVSAWAGSGAVPMEALAGREASPDDQPLNVGDEAFGLRLDRYANVKGIRFQDRTLQPPLAYSFFELDGKLADADAVGDGVGTAFHLSSEQAAGTLDLHFEKDLRLHFRPEEKNAVKEVGLALSYPLDTVFHLAEYINIGRKLDKDMPVGQTYSESLLHNLILVEAAGMWLRLRTDDPHFSKTKIRVTRHPEMFTAAFTWGVDTDVHLAAFPSMEAALEDHKAWLEGPIGIKKLRGRANAPAWIHDIKEVITFDMMRSNWEITHDYMNLLNFAKAVNALGKPKPHEVLFYIPGWQGAYDRTLPDYRPHPDLGGDDKFREMISGLHQMGFKVMIHTTGLGIDPYCAEIDALLPLAKKDAKGNFQGWMLGGDDRSLLEFRTRRIPLAGPVAASSPRHAQGSLTFRTDIVPTRCEAFFSIGGLPNKDARISLRVGRRTVTSPAGWFENHEDYDFPFPLTLEPGANEVRIATKAASDVDWSPAWYKIRHCFQPRDPYSSYTYPILQADTSHPEYIRRFTDSVRDVVREFGIDAVHVDATTFDEARPMYLTLAEKLPGIAIACEWSLTFDALGYWTFWQNCQESITQYPRNERQRNPCEQECMMPTDAEVDDIFAWMNKTSPVCSFVRDYMIPYPHLCAANAFVPVGKVCNPFPARQMPPDKETLWKVLRDTKRFNYVPALRVNYRKYGIDPDTQKALMELA